MSKIKVRSEVTVYEKNGEKVPAHMNEKVDVSSHWNRDELVRITLPDGERVVVLGKDLKRAVDNAMNTGR